MRWRVQVEARFAPAHDPWEKAGVGADAYVLEVGRARPLKGMWWSAEDSSVRW